MTNTIIRQFVLQHFPKFELSYDIITHKKVHDANIILAIPEGNKYFAWFTSYKNNNVCFLLQINENKNIGNVEIVNASFTDKLALGTIFYGTLFSYCKNNIYFCIEDLYYYVGKSCINLKYFLKLEILRDIFKNEICQTALTNKFIIFGLPLILNDLKLILKEIQLLPYKISELKFRYFDIKKIYAMKYIKPGYHHNNAIFKITADIEPDIYNLFIYKDGTEVFYDIAFIPNYNTSVMMNKLFRKIKENDNLDAIEESDNEEEFQNNKEDKYVYLDRSFKMNCEFNNKFKRWMPISLASRNDNIISIRNLLQNY
jgi:hypothetical protein